MARPNRFSKIIKTSRGEQAEGESATATKTRGRPVKGKSSNPDYESTTIYLPKALKRQAVKILFDERDRGLSDVVAELLEEWVDKNS